MNQQHEVMRLEDISAAGLVMLPFLAIFVVLSFIVPFQYDQMEAADPIVQAVHAWTGIGAIPILSIIPPEESAEPGILLGLGAGISEEVIFRLMIVPVAYTLALQVTKPQMAMVVAILVTGVLFALGDEIGPGAGQFQWEHFVTRFVSAGSLMSVLFFWPGPAFVISMHSRAH